MLRRTSQEPLLIVKVDRLLSTLPGMSLGLAWGEKPEERMVVEIKKLLENVQFQGFTYKKYSVL